MIILLARAVACPGGIKNAKARTRSRRVSAFEGLRHVI